MNENRVVGNLTIFHEEQALTAINDEQHGIAPARRDSQLGNPLQIEDLPVDTPLDIRVLDADGTLLLDIGAVVDTVRRAQLFRYFRPHRPRDATPQAEDGSESGQTSPYGAEFAETPSTGGLPPDLRVGATDDDDALRVRRAINEMGLSIGNRLGIRLPLGNGGLAYASRLIGVAPHGPLMVMPPVLDHARLKLTVGETVEVVAVCPRSIYLFACTVEWLATMPFHHVVLSPPARIRKLRERRAIRSPARLAVLYTPSKVSLLDPSHKSAPLPSPAPDADVTADATVTSNGDASVTAGGDAAEAAANPVADAAMREAPGLGVAINVSTFGMLLAADRPLGAVGEQLKINFYVEAEGVPVAVDVEGTIRSVKQTKSKDPSTGDWVHGLAFATLTPTQYLVLKSYVLSLRVEHDWN